jgi:tetratricopeptide (TPR) repeat protein
MKNWVVIVLVVITAVVTAAAFLPSLFNDFVDWDDPQLVTDNETIKGFTAENVKKMFTTNYLGHYVPLVMVSFAAEYHFSGLDPFVYHLTNYVLHILITIAVFYFILLLSGEAIVAFVVAILFGVHPLHVESVAWVTERKDLLYSIFYMLALIAYVGYLKRGKAAFYILCLVLTAVSLFSKAMAVTIPIVLILLDWYYRRGINKKVILEKVPFFALAFVVGLINLKFEIDTGATHLTVSTASRIYFLAKEIPFYLYKTVLPVNLSALYPYHKTLTPQEAQATFFYIAIVVALVVLVVISRKYTRKVVFGSLLSFIMILPVLKIIPAGSAFAADRYMYLPSIGVFYIFAVFLNWVYYNKTVGRTAMRVGLVLVFAAMTLALSAQTWMRCAVWKNTATLFKDVIRTNPRIPVPYNKVGAYLAANGQLDEAIIYFKKALEIRPDFVLAEQNLRRVYVEKGEDPGKASAFVKKESVKTTEAEKAAEEEGRDIYKKVWALNRTGVEQGKSGNYDGAIASFLKAIELDPDYAESYNNLGFAYYRKGEYAQAEGYFRKALEVDPAHQRARKNLETIQRLQSETVE